MMLYEQKRWSWSAHKI